MLPKYNPREVGFLFSLSQVGLEMVAPLVIGILLDAWWGTGPWLLIAGAIFGFGGGFLHMLVLLKNHEKELDSPKEIDSPKQPPEEGQ